MSHDGLKREWKSRRGTENKRREDGRKEEDRKEGRKEKAVERKEEVIKEVCDR